MTKKNVLFIEFIALLLIILLAIVDANFENVCMYVPEYGYSVKYCETFALSLFPLLSLIPFSIIFFFLREEVFRAWWNFARWFVLVIMFITLLISVSDTGGGMAGAMGDSFSYFILGVLYTIFVVTSLVKIARAYRRVK